MPGECFFMGFKMITKKGSLYPANLFSTGPRNAEASQERKATMKKKSLSSRAGLQFPVARCHRFLKDGKYAERVSVGAAVYIAGIMEYLTAEVIELAGNAARDNHKQR